MTGKRNHNSADRSYLLVFFISLLLILPLALTRFVAMDEGFYLMAGRLVAQGRMPYADFFYPQMPILPFLYAVWGKIAGFDWYSARLHASLVSALVCMLSYVLILRRSSKAWAVLGTFLLLANTLSLTWLATSKTYAYSILFCLLSLYFYEKYKTKHKNLFLTLCGLCVGLAVGVRLMFAVMVPVLLMYIFLSTPKGQRVKAVLAYFAGGFLSLIPHFLLMYLNYENYWFNNLGYHLIRANPTVLANMNSKQEIFGFLFGFEASKQYAGFQFPILFTLSALTSFSFFLSKRKLDIYFVSAFVMGVAHFLPNPSFIQYFSVLPPLFVICIFNSNFSCCDLSLRARILFRSFGLLLFIAYIWAVPSDLYRYTKSGVGVPGVRGEASKLETRISTLEKVAMLVDARSDEQEIVLSRWPGYLFSTKAQPVLGLENHFWVRVSDKLSSEERLKYHLSSLEHLRSSVKQRMLRLVVLDLRKMRRYLPRRLLESSGYRLVEKVGNIGIFEKVD